MNVDVAKTRREGIRWLILLALNHARPLGHGDAPVLSVVQSMYTDSTLQEIRKELDYLALRELVNLDKQPHGHWHCTLTRAGIDVAEYSVPCEPGIARPAKYW